MLSANIQNNEFSKREYLAFIGASLLEDKKSVFVGTGIPILSAMLAQKTHAPNLLIVFEAGSIGPLVRELPVSVGDSRTYYKGIMATSMHDVMSLSQQGYIDFGFLGAAQMDVYGNINTTVIGNHDMPKVRLPGSGGANDVASFSHKLIINIAKQSRTTFVNKVDFLTTPGYLTGLGSREKAGLPEGTGPHRVVTQLGTYGFDEASKKLKLLTIHHGETLESIKNNSSFDIIIPPDVEASPKPPKEYLDILRKEIDPAGIILGKEN